MAEADNKSVIDGNADWSGGMDTSKSVGHLAENQFVYSVNMEIPPTYGGIRTRRGFRCLELFFNTEEEREIYEQGKIQGEGWYYNGEEVILLCSVDGWIFEFRFVSTYKLRVRILNGWSQNNPNNNNAWFTRVPYGCIMNDGESLPFFISKDEVRRSNPKKDEIGPGCMGVYVQNRFFYVLPDKTFINASTIQNPLSLTEAKLNNIYGFSSPEDEDFITAIGRQQTISRDAHGGNLSFSTLKNTYSVDVRGDRTDWGKLATKGVGYVDNSVPDIGAVSPYSYESFNGNVYFRNNNYGFMSSKQAQYQFINLDSYYSHSIEARLFFENDNEVFLQRCYTRGYKAKLYTTIAPEFSDNGGIIWNGIIVYAPDIYYSRSEKAERRYESVYTGIRPWCITVTEDIKKSNQMFIHSRDYDNVNRLYVFDESIDYDVNFKKEKIDIESKLLTRGYLFKVDFLRKSNRSASYSLKQIPRDTNLSIFTRDSDNGPFKELWNQKHLVNPCCISNNKNGLPCFKPMPVHAEDREHVPISNKDDSKFFMKQDLFVLKGSASLKRWYRSAVIESQNFAAAAQEKRKPPHCYEESRIYTYKLI